MVGVRVMVGVLVTVDVLVDVGVALGVKVLAGTGVGVLDGVIRWGAEGVTVGVACWEGVCVGIEPSGVQPTAKTIPIPNTKGSTLSMNLPRLLDQFIQPRIITPC